MNEALPLLGALLVTLLVLVGAYFFTRWAAKGGFLASSGFVPGSGRLQVLDRLSLGKDQWMLVVRVGQRYFLLGSSPSGLSLLCELTQQEGEEWSTPGSHDHSSQRTMPDFGVMLRRMRDKDTVEKR